MPKSQYVAPEELRAAGIIHFEDMPMNQYNKTIEQELKEGNFTKADLLGIYADMLAIREFERMLMSIKRV